MPLEDFTPPSDRPERIEKMYDDLPDDRVSDFEDPGDTSAEPVELYSEEEKQTFFLDAGGER